MGEDYNRRSIMCKSADRDLGLNVAKTAKDLSFLASHQRVDTIGRLYFSCCLQVDERKFQAGAASLVPRLAIELGVSSVSC